METRQSNKGQMDEEAGQRKASADKTWAKQPKLPAGWAGKEKVGGCCDDSSQISKRAGDNAPNREIPALVQPCRNSGQGEDGGDGDEYMRMLSRRRKERGKDEKAKERRTECRQSKAKENRPESRLSNHQHQKKLS
jgi:hypothetical protein